MKSPKDKKTILFLCNYQAPYCGNFVSSLISLEAQLELRGHKAIYAFPDKAVERYWYKELIKQGKMLISFNFDQKKFKEVRDILDIINKYEIDVVHVHFGGLITSGICSILKRHITFIWHLHSDFSLGNKKNTIKENISDFIQFSVINNFVKIISVSEHLAEKSKKIFYVPNGLSRFRFTSTHYTRNEMRAKCNINDDEKLIIMFGWSPIVKGVDIAVNAINSLQSNKNYKIKLGIVCGREYVPERMREFIASNTNCQGSEPWIIYLDPIDDVFQYHNASDIFLSASRSEGFPYSILEALSVGNKCVISDIPGVQWSKDFELTFPFESQNYNDCAVMINKAIQINVDNNKDIARSVEQKYSIENWCNEIIKIYGI